MSADWWQNFPNNFASDLAPLVSLLGDSPTKQYLSETLTFLDIFIFSMAPIGVVTAIVSAIRVAGDPLIRAFIGRAQEGGGLAEAELCSSTSRDVCELYNNGGIARVFGRPKILEFVHDPSNGKQHPLDSVGIYSFGKYLSNGNWKEKGTKEYNKRSPDKEISQPPPPVKPFAPHPNLSLNVGIQKLPRIWFYLASVVGFALQAGVLVFAALTAYAYPSTFKTDDSQISAPAFPFACAGTILLCFGVGMCGSIIERSTRERVFEREEGQPFQLYWIQPGGQVVGDQIFDSFAYSDGKKPVKEYTTSWKHTLGEDSKQSLLQGSQSIHRIG